MNINELAKEIHENAVAHGWWEKEPSFGEIIALCHSELSEALEEYRDGKSYIYCHYNTCGDCKEHNQTCIQCTIEQPTVKPEGTAVELIDCVIRIFDYLEEKGFDIEQLIIAKNEYNKTRPYKHGGKKI